MYKFDTSSIIIQILIDRSIIVSLLYQSWSNSTFLFLQAEVILDKTSSWFLEYLQSERMNIDSVL